MGVPYSSKVMYQRSNHRIRSLLKSVSVLSMLRPMEVMALLALRDCC